MRARAIEKDEMTRSLAVCTFARMISLRTMLALRVFVCMCACVLTMGHNVASQDVRKDMLVVPISLPFPNASSKQTAHYYQALC